MLLELCRIICIFVILGGIGILFLHQIYTVFGLTQTWPGNIGIFLVLFTLYRNKWQFTGWYNGSKRGKLPRNMTFFIHIGGILFMILPFMLS